MSHDDVSLLDPAVSDTRQIAALRDVLAAISANRSDEQPVFDTIVAHALRLCDATNAGLILATAEDSVQKMVSEQGVPEATKTLFETGQMKVDPNLSYAARCIVEGRVVAFDDMKESDLYVSGSPVVRSMVDESQIRSVLFVPLLTPDGAIGCLTLLRGLNEIRPFHPDLIALSETFAAQAVIAIENVRQFRAVQDQLERETSSAEVLDIISRSREDDLPVFEKITQSVVKLCNAAMGYIAVLNPARTHVTIPAQFGARPEFADRLSRFKVPVEEDWIMAVDAALNRKVIRIEDLAEDALYKAGNEYRVSMVDEEGMRSVLVVPLVSGDVGLGCIFLYRRDVRPFSDAELELVRGFAAQAVIAIENVRQFREVQTRLEREKASAEVLQVISTSRDDEAPVFDAILKRAADLCRSPYVGLALLNEAGTHLTYTASHGPALPHSQIGDMQWALNGETSFAQAVRLKRPVQIDDMKNSALYKAGDPQRVAHVEKDGIETFVAVPMFQNGEVIGAFGLARFEQSAFSQDDIDLVETFAAQAVIAIENVRQFRALEALNAELGNRVEQQVGEIERMGRLKRFLPAAVADTVVSSGSEDMLKSHRALLGVLFCDIRGFTAFCETAEPEETIEVLQTYHEEMGKLINAHNAGVDHRMGDGIMVLFNDPVPCEDPAGDAVRLALAMQARMTELCKAWKRLGHRLGFGVGISLGYATVGMVGYEGRSDYTASGTAVNLAARLCDLAEDREILLSTRAAIAVEDDIPVEPAGEVTLKGIREPVEVFRLKSAT